MLTWSSKVLLVSYYYNKVKYSVCVCVCVCVLIITFLHYSSCVFLLCFLLYVPADTGHNTERIKDVLHVAY